MLTATAQGAAHVGVGLPNQDAVAVEPAGANAVVAAVADGHGHHRHFRSGRGARLAVGVACQLGTELARRLPGDGPPGDGAPGVIEAEISARLVPGIVANWRAAVDADLAEAPFTPAEQELRAPGDEPVIAYGSTLLLAVAGRRWLVLVQIGDGDIVAVLRGGGALLPVPGDPALNGRLTTSLCEPAAETEFRVAVVDQSSTELLAVLLATDGYGNAQAADAWSAAFGADLATLLTTRGADWLASQVSGWAARCASAEGSADDATVALLLAPGGLAPDGQDRATAPGDSATADTIPGVPADPAGQVGGAA